MNTQKEDRDHAGIIGGCLFTYSILSILLVSAILFVPTIINISYITHNILFMIWGATAVIGFWVAPFVVMRSNDEELKFGMAKVFK